MGERETRRQLINRSLERAGWLPIIKYRENFVVQTASVEEYETEYGPANYVLYHRGEALAIVEAKKLVEGPQSAIEQTKRYARGFKEGRFDFHGYEVPFIYSTNREVIFFQDLRDQFSLPRTVSHFHNLSALRTLLIKDVMKSIAWLKNTPIDDYGLRGYQQEAIRSIEEALVNGKRQMIVAMASGTSKTYS
jgi:type I restriction enzyme R subunit